MKHNHDYEDASGGIGQLVGLIVIVAVLGGALWGFRVATAAEALSPETSSLIAVSEQLNPSSEIMAMLETGVVHGPDEPLAMRDVLLEVCRERGYGEACARHLLGMMWKESLFDHDAVGDQGRALGYFQIHYRLHRVAPECATDARCSAHWTIDYLESNGYPKHVSYAVQCHNGCNAGNGYAASALRWGDRKWAEADARAAAIAAAKVELAAPVEALAAAPVHADDAAPVHADDAAPSVIALLPVAARKETFTH
jgi:hypothetical protein